MIVRCLLALTLTLCCLLTQVGLAQTDDEASIIEEDYRVKTVEDRQQAVANLLAKADELQRSGQTVEAARTLNRVGRFQIRMSLAPDALATFQKALDLLEQSSDIKTRVDSLNGLAGGYDYLSKCKEAEPLANEVIALGKQNNYAAGEAEGLLTLSDCQNHRDHELALQTAHRSLELWQSIGRKRGMADANKVIGHYHLSQSNLTECTRSMEAALALYRELNDTDRQAAVLSYLAMIEQQKGAWQTAMTLWSQMQSMIDEKAEPYKMGQISLGLGNAFLESGLPDVALAKYREALQYFITTKNQRAISIIHSFIGRAHYFLRNYSEALENLQRARDNAYANNDLTVTATCDEFLGRTQFSLGNPTAALSAFQSALDGYAKAKSTLEVARTQALMGQVYQQQSKLDTAAKNYQTALNTFRALADHVNESATLFALGNLELQRNNLPQAEQYLKQSIDVTENIRRVSTSNDLTVAFTATVYDRYQSYIECLMRRHFAQPDQGFDKRAFETSELARGRSLAELLRATETNLAPGVDPQLMDQEKTLRKALRVKEDQRVALLARQYKREELTAVENELATLDKEHDQVVASIQSQYPAYKQITSPAAWELKQIQELVIPDGQTVLLEYSLGKRKSYVWAVTRERLVSYELPEEAVIVEKANALYGLLSSRLNADKTTERNQIANDLSRLLLVPLATELDKKRLIVVADGALNYIPFQMLARPSNGSGELVSSLEIVNAPSASILGGLRHEIAARKNGKLLAVFGDPVFESNYTAKSGDENQDLAALNDLEHGRWRQALRDIELTGDPRDTSVMKPLFYVKQEVANLRDVASGAQTFVATDFDATRERFLNTDLSGYSIIHIATHGLLDPKRPENSGIVLSTVTRDHKPQNGFVSLPDIYQLRAPADLVVLSACQTGLGKDVRGEGLIGLTRGFMYAGASSVVASLWKVDDEATAELMKRFYTNMLHNGMPPAAALRAAQNSIRQESQWSSPYYWAAFTLQGDFRQTIKPVQPRRLVSSTLLAAILASLIAGGGLFYFIRRKRAVA